MAKKKGGPAYYSVRFGRAPGIYMTWDECEAQVKGFTGAKYKKFPTKQEAEDFLCGGSGTVIDLLDSNASKLASAAQNSNIASAATSKKRSLEHEDDDSTHKKQRVIPEHEVEGEDLVVYSDGACKGNGKKGSVAGVGVWWGHDDPRNIAERCPGDQTNNRAELIAIARVLESTPVDTKCRLVIKTDSNYSIQCFDSWLHNWRKNNWKASTGQPVKNAPLIRYIAALLEGRISLGQKVRFVYVKGHAGIEGNEGADYLANRGALAGELEERDWLAEEARYRKSFEEKSAELKRADLEVEYTVPAPGITEAGTTAQEKEVRKLDPTYSTQNDALDADELAKYAEGWADNDDLSDDLKA